MRAWVKLWTEILHDRKMALLTDRQFRICINLIAMAGIEDKDGELMLLDDMAFQLRMTSGDLKDDLAELERVNIVAAKGGQYRLVHFGERQPRPPSADPSAVLERVHRYREKARGERNASVTTRNVVTPNCNEGVTTPVTSVTSVTTIEEKREEKIRGEKMREDPETAAAAPPRRGGALSPEFLAASVKRFESSIGIIASAHMQEDICSYLEDLEAASVPTWWDLAISEAEAQNKRSWAYVRGILKTCLANKRAPGASRAGGNGRGPQKLSPAEQALNMLRDQRLAKGAQDGHGS